MAWPFALPVLPDHLPALCFVGKPRFPARHSFWVTIGNEAMVIFNGGSCNLNASCPGISPPITRLVAARSWPGSKPSRRRSAFGRSTLSAFPSGSISATAAVPRCPAIARLPPATVVVLATPAEETPIAALTRFCRRLCPAPRLAAAPICGNNNWYYAYGRNFDADAMRRDAAFLAEIASGHVNRPYCVIDAGWTPGSVCPGGPWTAGDPKRFPDMPGLAADIKRLGVRPGIWVRPTALMKVVDPRRLRSGPCTAEEKPLDLTLPENLSLIHDDIARIRSWGYDLIKHDFSTYDMFAKWGFEMGAELTADGWHFADQSLTNAEIILRLYRTLRAAAGDAVLLGCNTIGHLGAGLFELQRTGDDTSGRIWERTRRMGINTLAYRLPQHGTFFASDADCAAHTDRDALGFRSPVS